MSPGIPWPAHGGPERDMPRGGRQENSATGGTNGDLVPDRVDRREDVPEGVQRAARGPSGSRVEVRGRIGRVAVQRPRWDRHELRVGMARLPGQGVPGPPDVAGGRSRPVVVDDVAALL